MGTGEGGGGRALDHTAKTFEYLVSILLSNNEPRYLVLCATQIVVSVQIGRAAEMSTGIRLCPNVVNFFRCFFLLYRDCWLFFLV